MRKEQKNGFGIVGIIIILAAVAVLGGGFLYWRELWRLKNLTAPPPAPATQNQQVQQPTPSAPPAEIDISNWKTYRNEQYGFEVRYPASLIVEAQGPALFVLSIDGSPKTPKEFFSLQEREPKGIDRYAPDGAPLVGKVMIGGRESLKYYTPARRIGLLCNINYQFADYLIPAGVSYLEIQLCGVENNFKLFEDILSTFKFIK